MFKIMPLMFNFYNLASIYQPCVSTMFICSLLWCGVKMSVTDANILKNEPYVPIKKKKKKFFYSARHIKKMIT